MRLIPGKQENDFEVVKEKNVIKFTFFTKEGDGFNINQSLLYTHLTEIKDFDTIIFEFPNMIYLDSTTIGRIIKSFKQIFEKSIGSEEIRKKWYSDLPKKTFYSLVNIDPTSVRKKDFSKPGKYSKWLIREYKKGNLNDNLLEDNEFCKKLLFIYTFY